MQAGGIGVNGLCSTQLGCQGVHIGNECLCAAAKRVCQHTYGIVIAAAIGCIQHVLDRDRFMHLEPHDASVRVRQHLLGNRDALLKLIRCQAAGKQPRHDLDRGSRGAHRIGVFLQHDRAAAKVIDVHRRGARDIGRRYKLDHGGKIRKGGQERAKRQQGAEKEEYGCFSHRYLLSFLVLCVFFKIAARVFRIACNGSAQRVGVRKFALGTQVSVKGGVQHLAVQIAVKIK